MCVGPPRQERAVGSCLPDRPPHASNALRCDNPRVPAFAIMMLLAAAAPAAAQPAPASRDSWIALAKGGFVVPDGRTAIDLLVEMNALLASDDPVLRDDVAYSAAERWILRDRRLSPADLR